MRISDWSSDVCSSELFDFTEHDVLLHRSYPMRQNMVVCYHRTPAEAAPARKRSSRTILWRGSGNQERDEDRRPDRHPQTRAGGTNSPRGASARLGQGLGQRLERSPRATSVDREGV